MISTVEMSILAPPQRRMWFLEQLEPGRPEANLACGFRVVGGLDRAALARAVERVVAANAVLRTRFAEVDGVGPRQIVEAGGACRVIWEELGGNSPAGREREWAARVPAMVRIPFTVGILPLFRLHVGCIGPQVHLLLVVMHHIVSDGDESARLLVEQVVAQYGAAEAAAGPPSARTPSPHAVEAPAADGLAFWRGYLDDAPQQIVLPRSGDGGLQSALAVRVPAAVVGPLRELAARDGATLSDALLTAFGLLLKVHAHQDDLLIGWPYPCREGRGGEIGYFGNPLPIRVVLPDGQTYRQALVATAASVRRAVAHAGTPFEEIVQAVGVRGGPGKPLFQVMFDLQPQAPVIEGGGLTVRPEWWDMQLTEYEWSLFLADETDGSVSGRLEFQPGNHSAAAMTAVAARYLLLLETMVADPQAAAYAPPTGADCRQLARWTSGAATALPARCAHDLFEEQARATPDAPAIEYRGEVRSYRELNEAANRLARQLAALGIGPEVVVALSLERSIAAVTALLAIWKAGGAFLPLDPAYPQERLAFMLQDSRARILLTQEKLLPQAPTGGDTRVLLLEELEQAALGADARDLGLPAHHDQLNYIIYTSGSTGVPKGIAMVHRCLANLIQWQHGHSPMRGEVRALQFASLNFDICFQELFTTWAGGGTVVLISEEMRRDPLALLDYLCAHRINRLFLPFVALQQLALAAQGRSVLPVALRQIFTAGEQLRTTPALRALFQRLPGCTLHNQYGPSEAHVITCHDLPGDPESWVALPAVGRPLLNTRIHLVDGALRLVPPGAPGEVLVGGAGLARGYNHRPDATADKFIRDPFSDDPDARLYRTGDLARHLPDGSIEFLRRIDQQVKVRGFRIELGEVEAVIGRHPEVRETVVLALGEAGNSQLAAYVVPQAQEGPQSGQVAHWQAVWEETYRSAPDTDFNLAGWNSSYTGESLAAADMREWRDQTVARILALKPRRVLEIGCGAGLLLAGVAPHCDFYAGTDFSAEIVQRLAARVADTPALAGRVVVRQAEALELDDWPEQSFDTVVLNSVLQLFPDGGYLERVLAKAARLVAPGGHIFVGDVQHLDLLEAYHAGVQFQRSPAHARLGAIEAQWKPALAREDQLMVAPSFFTGLGARLPAVTDVVLNLKRGRRANELVNFRYDVVLEIDGARTARRLPEALEWAGFEDVEQRLRSNPDAPVYVLGVPNARVRFDTWLTQCTDRNATKAEVLAAYRAGGVEPEDCWELAHRMGVHCSVVWSADAACFDVLWSRDAGLHPAPIVVEGKALTNDPSRDSRDRAFVAALRAWLVAKLPEYMIPGHIIVLDALPVKTNGKVDRAALPRPEDSRSRADAQWVAPLTDAERAVAALWEETLAVSRADMNDDFFAMGGHSLLAVQLLFHVRQRLNVEIPLAALFEGRTLRFVAGRVEAGIARRQAVAAEAPELMEEGVL